VVEDEFRAVIVMEGHVLGGKNHLTRVSNNGFGCQTGILIRNLRLRHIVIDPADAGNTLLHDLQLLTEILNRLEDIRDQA
jgi:hypothetical protein